MIYQAATSSCYQASESASVLLSPGSIMHLNFVLTARQCGWAMSEANGKCEKSSPLKCKAALQMLLFLLG